MKGNFAATVLVLVGSYFLLSNLGLIQVSFREIISVWWPVVLIAVGVSMFFTPGGKK
jgi:hypothetical protein